ncbi:hypothetical protein [Halocalculus aciditolerans]|uniref:PGF-CTERM sorting domain-containing protein n=1 Tax=Halocalculus aciditolerans TaxID=1383812 RepID=A0A830F449_9EURY|nr:hypothetical protein [Halocalculus aciditolerans]GGL60794.1 hypothetical protein GCM10009039_18790 [Halocalculus aciditolerans]
MDSPARGALAALLTVTVVAGAFTGAAAAASNGSITAGPATPGASSTHATTVTVGDDATGSWNGFAVDYGDAGADVSDVAKPDIQKIGIDYGDDDTGETVDVTVRDDLDQVSASNNGNTLTLTLGGSYSLNATDEVVVVYTNVTNPEEAGEYDVSLDVNPQSSGGETNATLAIGSSDGGTTTQSTTTTQSGGSDTTTAGGSGGETTTQTSSPGFGVTAAAVAALGVAVVALRRRE